MMDAILSYIHTQYIVTGAAGGFLHVWHERKFDTKEVVPYMLAAILLANFFGPLVLDLAPDWLAHANHAADGVGLLLGYGVSRICRAADRRMDKGLNGHEGPEHD